MLKDLRLPGVAVPPPPVLYVCVSKTMEDFSLPVRASISHDFAGLAASLDAFHIFPGSFLCLIFGGHLIGYGW